MHARHCTPINKCLTASTTHDHKPPQTPPTQHHRHRQRTTKQSTRGPPGLAGSKPYVAPYPGAETVGGALGAFRAGCHTCISRASTRKAKGSKACWMTWAMAQPTAMVRSCRSQG